MARTWAGRCFLAPQHPQVVGGVGEVVPRGYRVLALLDAVDGGQQRGDHGAQAERLGPQLVVVDVQGRPPPELGAEDRDPGAQGVERRARRGQDGEHPSQSVGERPQRCHLLGEGGRRRPGRGGPRRTGGTRRPRATAVAASSVAEYWR